MQEAFLAWHKFNDCFQQLRPITKNYTLRWHITGIKELSGERTVILLVGVCLFVCLYMSLCLTVVRPSLPLHISEFSEIIREGKEYIKRETNEDGQTVKVVELHVAGPKREGYFIIQVCTHVLI